ncbi:DNA recombination protein RmuC [Rhodanobacter sp. UC4451_H18]
MSSWELFSLVAVAAIVSAAVSGWLMRLSLIRQAKNAAQTSSDEIQGLQEQIREFRAIVSRLEERERNLGTQLQAFDLERTSLNGTIGGLRKESEAARIEASGARQQSTSSNDQLGQANKALEGMKNELGQAQRDLRAQSNGLIGMTAERDAALELVKQTKAFVDSAKESMRTAFIEEASSVFDQKSAVLDQRIKATGEHSKALLADTLKPFVDNIDKFKERMEELGKTQTQESSTLRGSIEQLQTLNQHMAEATGDLTRALKGNAKVRGDWGEMILDGVLTTCGFIEGVNYQRQESNKDEETGKQLRPDVIFDLPDGRRVVIDSKVNLVAWAEAAAAESVEERQMALTKHAAALRTHVKDLHGKNYPKVVGDDALELTVLFVPIEGALAEAMASDPSLQTDAMKNNIAFASPNTLMALLKVVERMWVRDKFHTQVEAIRKVASNLMDSLTAFLTEFNAIEDKLGGVTKAYGQAKNRLYESNQSVVARGKKLVDAGARGNKALHKDLMPDLESIEEPAFPALVMIDGPEQ